MQIRFILYISKGFFDWSMTLLHWKLKLDLNNFIWELEVQNNERDFDPLNGYQRLFNFLFVLRIKGALSRQSTSFCLILPITRPQLKVSKEITCKWQNQRFETNKYVSWALFWSFEVANSSFTLASAKVVCLVYLFLQDNRLLILQLLIKRKC